MTLNPFETNACWKQNAQLLLQFQPRAFHILQQTPIPHNQLQVTQATDHSPNLSIRFTNGQTATLHDPQSPWHEAQRWVDALKKPIEQQTHFVLLGMGMGYPFFELFKRCAPSSRFWIVEPEPAFMKYALHCMDFSHAIQSERVHFLPGAKIEDVISALFNGEYANPIKAKGVQMLVPPYAQKIYSTYKQQLANQLSEKIQIEGLKFRTGEIQGRQILKNIIHNLPSLFQGAPWQRLLGAFAKKPAFIIAAGPSLEPYLHELYPLQDNALLIAVDTAHPILLRHGIHADLVVSLDFTELNAKHFDTIHHDQTLLLAYPGIDPAICQQYEGQTYFFDHVGNIHYNTSASPFLSSLTSLGPLGQLISYGSTSHSAYHAAQQMGCDPILFVGQDLAFPHNQWYAPGSMQLQLNQPDREEEEYLKVEANDGSLVQTSGLYKTYLDGFTELIQATKGHVINTSPHGAKIKGTKWMNFDKAIEHLPTTPIDKSKLQSKLSPSLDSQQEASLVQLKQWKERCLRLRPQLHILYQSLEQLNPQSPQFHPHMLNIMKDFISLAQQEPTVMHLCSSLCSRSTTAMLGELGNTNLFSGSTPQHNQEAQSRVVSLFQEFDNALEIHAQLLSELS